jgi:hypothetical protein
MHGYRMWPARAMKSLHKESYPEEDKSYDYD